ncbi:hypothetical protein K439DRAFT_1620245 [Ramaria rubella]|nr:hypothetical protein K439DRAFT_1620245 [Ramaria rubella]
MRASKKYTGRSPSQACGIAKRAKGVVRDSEADDDGKYNSTATVAEVLQAISKHIHCSKFVSVSKCIEKPSDLIPHSLNPNREALEALITKPAVGKALLVHLKKKSSFLWPGQTVSNLKWRFL